MGDVVKKIRELFQPDNHKNAFPPMPNESDEDMVRSYILKEMQEKGQSEVIRDKRGIRWVKCQICDLVAPEDRFGTYGGAGKMNLGICKECSKKPETLEMIRKGLI